MAELKFTLEPLDVDNYATWAFKMRNWLVVKDLWDAIEGGSSVSPSVDAKALAYIRLCVKEYHMPTLASVQSAKEAWEVLEATYKSKSEARKISLHQELLHLKKSNGEDITQYISRAKCIRDDLVAAGENPKSINVIAPVLNGLPASFTPLCLALIAQSASLTLEELESKLISAQALLQEEDKPRDPTAAAFVARKAHDLKSVRCHFCDQPGHVIRNCRKLREIKEKMNGQSSKPSNVAF
jgi:hypothetical protein